MNVDRQCKCCNSTFKARSADVNRGWALFCSKRCKAIEQERNKKKVKSSIVKKNLTVSQLLDNVEFTYTRKDLIEKLNKNMVYEWDNAVFEESLQFNVLSKAYDYVTQHS